MWHNYSMAACRTSGYTNVMLPVFSAGTRDSPLTIHGSLQADRLARYFVKNGVRPTHLFSSDLQRAYKTAEAIASASRKSKEKDTKYELAVQKLPVLREQDFGYYEGKPFYAKPKDSANSGLDHHRSQHTHNKNYKDVESKESMAKRMDSFLDEHIVPRLRSMGSINSQVIVIVAHGIILSTLWKCLLKRFTSQDVRLGNGVTMGGGASTTLEHLGAWSNTGYLELDIKPSTKTVYTVNAASTLLTVHNVPKMVSESHTGPKAIKNLTIVIRAVNSKEHVKGLKRTGGGVGSSKFDEGQKTIESFFKKRKI